MFIAQDAPQIRTPEECHVMGEFSLGYLQANWFRHCTPKGVPDLSVQSVL